MAIFCSDERFASATLEFLRRHLDMDRCDLFVVAGGSTFVIQNEISLTDRLELLTKARKIKNIALVAHKDCGYYKHRYPNLTPDELKRKQIKYLSTAISLLR